MNYLHYQLDALFDLLFSIQGIVLLLLYGLFCILAISNQRLRWFALMLLIWSTTLTAPTTSDTTSLPPPLVGPLETMRVHARSISSAMAIALILPALLAPRGWRRIAVPAGVGAYLVFQLTFSSLELYANVSAKTALSGPLFVATFIGVGVGACKWIQSVQDAKRLLWAAVVAMGLFCAATCLQLAINPNAVIRGTRLMGTTANPQFAAVMIAATLLPAFYLLLDREQSKAARTGVAVLIGVMGVFLFWTGSRTGMLMACVGLFAFFRLRLGKMVAAGLIAAIFISAAFFIFGEASSGNTERFLRGPDTRSYVWARQWSAFLDNPVGGTVFAGTGGFSSGGGENSYLTVAGSYGLIGMLPMLVMIILMAREVSIAFALRRYLPERSMLIDLIFAGFISTAVGAFFEAFLLGQFHLIVFLLFIYAGIGAFIRDEAAYALQIEQMSADDPSLAPRAWASQY